MEMEFFFTDQQMDLYDQIHRKIPGYIMHLPVSIEGKPEVTRRVRMKEFKINSIICEVLDE